MATGTANIESTSISSEERYIEEQLDKTGLQVKLVDLFGGLMMLAVATLGFLLFVAVVDAWLFDLGRWGRLLSLLTIIFGALAYLVVYVAPLVFRKVNPVYAARTIEQAEPSLKNGLINFLMFRSERQQVEQVVYQALEHQAAVGLSNVPIETTVDRTKLIKLGYVLAGVVVICGVYKILSPKDPFQSFARVAAPLADIGRPTRVQILDIKPGDDLTIFYGTKVIVSARISGLDDESSATLIFSTTDGQQQDRRVPMILDGENDRFQCELTTGKIGIEQDLIYHIEAGDAFTRDYQVRVRTAPTIAVESVRYDYPVYVDRPPHLVEGQGNIKALEGAKVTITAVANLPIKNARIELRSASDSSDATSSQRTQSVAMTVKDQKASGQFYLELRADRETPAYSEYVVHFTTVDGYRNEQPAEYRIQVIPDLAPDVEILTPRRERVEVPSNRSQTIEIRALDPDFALRQVTLRAASSGTDLLNAVLLSAPSKAVAEKNAGRQLPDVDAKGNPLKYLGHIGQAVVTYEFSPRSLNLKPGDEVVFWALAHDNRTSVRHQLPEPNAPRTGNFYIKITPPESSGGASASADSTEDEDKDDPKKDDSEEEGSNDSKGSSGDKSTGAGSAEQGDSGEAEKGDASGGDSSGSDSSNADAGDSSSGGGEGTSSPSDGNPKGSTESSGSESTDQGNSNSTSESGSGKNDESNSPASKDGTSNSFESDGKNAGEGVGKGEASGNPDLDNASVKRNEDTEPQDSDSEEPLHEGEVFEKIIEHLKKKKDDKSEGGESGDGNESDNTDDKGQPKDNKSSNPPNADGSKGKGEPQPNGEGSKDDQASDQGENKGNASAKLQGSKGTDENKGANDSLSNEGDMNDGASGDPSGSAETRKENANDKAGSEKQDNDGQGETGDAGAGREADDKAGSPESQGENRERDKTGESDAGESKKGEEAESPSNSNKQSDSKGENAGDRSGGGGKGGGQDANQAGKDTDGSNTSADSGAGASDESGMGETGGEGGSDKTAADKTGSSGEEAGAGSDTRADPKGDELTKRQGDRPSSEAGNPRGNGGIANTAGGSGLDDGEITPGEKANLKYAEKATDLALDYLRDKNAAADRELLDKLGWSEEELKNFIERWSQLKRKAKEGSSTDRSELTRSLRSLGLRSTGDKRRTASDQNDEFRDLRDDGFRATLPAKYIEQFNAFQRGAARAENDR